MHRRTGRQLFDNIKQNAVAYELNEKQMYVNARNKVTGIAIKKMNSADVRKLRMYRKHNRKIGKQEDYFYVIEKIQAPLQTVSVVRLGLLDATSKCYKYIFAIVDVFSKFTFHNKNNGGTRSSFFCG